MTTMAITRILIFAVVMIFNTTASAGKPTDASNGQLYHDNDETEVWSASAEKWLPVEDFWLAFANANDGKFWARSSNYPPFSEVTERDSFLVELEQGVCLMYFWHGRWRRAQDVWRWDEGFNQLLSCPYVFD
jgi:hypothetical protein